MNNSNAGGNSGGNSTAGNKRRGLGRGLGALIVDTQTTPPPAFETASEESAGQSDIYTSTSAATDDPMDAGNLEVLAGVQQLPLDQISPNPQQPRTHFDPEALAELADSIRAHGILQPLIVTIASGQTSAYWLIAGERRWRAARLAELETVPVIVREASPLQLVEWALVENLQRADLSPLEEANAYQTLIDAFTLTQAEIGQRVGKSRAAVANTLRLLQLPSEVQEALMDGSLSAGHARALLGLPNADLMRVALEQILSRGLSVRQTEELVKQLALQVTKPTTPEPSKPTASEDSQLAHMENHFRSILGTRVNLNRNRDGSGRLVVHFYSDEELAQIYQLIAGDDGSRYPPPDSIALGLFSHNEQHGHTFADRHAIPHYFPNLADLLAQPSIHCIYVGNHPRHHAQTVLAALAAGKHILCEPPLALTLEEAERVAHTALDRGRILAVNYQHRGDPTLRTLRELLADHTIGDLLGGRISHTGVLPPARQGWRLRTQGGGVLFDRTAHTVDLLRFLLRDEIEQAYCASTQQFLGDQVEEDLLGIYTMRRSGVAIQTHDSFLVPHAPLSLEFYGSTGRLTAYDCWQTDRPSELWLHRHGQPTRVPAAPIDRFFAAIKAFVQSVRTQGAPLAGGADAVNNLAILEAARDSIRRGQRVTVSLPMRRATDRAYS